MIMCRSVERHSALMVLFFSHHLWSSIFDLSLAQRSGVQHRSFVFAMKRLNNGFYQSHTWRRCRQAYAASVGGLCERCKSLGIITAGRVVHHKIELTEKNYKDEKIAYGFDNLMLLCQSCHEQVHKGKKPYKFDAEGNIVAK